MGVLVILLPNIISVAANSLVQTPSNQEIEKNIRTIHSNHLQKLHETNKAVAKKIKPLNLSRDEIRAARRENEWPRENRTGQTIRATETDFWNQVKKQEDLSRNLSLISPMGGLTESLVILANTSSDSQRNFMTSAYSTVNDSTENSGKIILTTLQMKKSQLFLATSIIQFRYRKGLAE